MQILKSNEVGREEIKKFLTKKAFDEIELPEKIRESNKKIFGEDLTASELVRKIVGDVRKLGDAAVIDYTKKFDGVELSAENFQVTDKDFADAEKVADKKIVESLKRAAENIFSFHQEQMPKSWLTYRGKNSILGQAVTPLEKVGVYVPGGTAAYPSSVLMNVIPAKVAGVEEIIMWLRRKLQVRIKFSKSEERRR